MLVSLPEDVIQVNSMDLESGADNSMAKLLLTILSVTDKNLDKEQELIRPIDGLNGCYLGPLNANIIFDHLIKDRYKYLSFYVQKENGDTEYPKPNCQCKIDEYEDPHDIMQYGVCDSPQQFAEHFIDILEKDPRKLFVTFYEVRREDQEPDGGWRYHKWGVYIGNQNPQHEHLYDDKHIDRVFCWHIYEMKD